ncbi:hypothetical protein RBSWK_05742 [Rhodopirellula baltica SWK14]|uniref:Uncharacterized protein n=1 Tax=Rhodopirellula baltica SWK14 TaxID=993516 RepID=L7CB40_RHOBT|nr:hypothetical protein RBSWK_05742 [Rhodopirellula baltica SWK14]
MLHEMAQVLGYLGRIMVSASTAPVNLRVQMPWLHGKVNLVKSGLLTLN